MARLKALATTIRLLAAGTLALAGHSVQALSPAPPQPDDFFLPALYQALGGENWTRNDGWMDPGIHWCDWYGVTCGEEYWPGRFEFVALDLSDNGLSGELSEELLDLFASGLSLPGLLLDLSSNALFGPLPVLPRSTSWVLLNDNQLSGPLPTAPPRDPADPPSSSPLAMLDLSDNDFTGPIPDSWPAQFEFSFLNLDNNRLEGSIANAVLSLRPDLDPPGFLPTFNQGLWLADNDFVGDLDPNWFLAREISSINLCWNRLQINDPDLAAWIAERHWGGPPGPCLDRDRLALDPTISGSWFDLQRPGEGLSLMLLDNGASLVYWFSHISLNRQLWLFNSGQQSGETLLTQPLLRTQGRFGAGFDIASPPFFANGALRLDRVNTETLHAEFRVGYSVLDLAQPEDIIVFIPLSDSGFRADHAQLTRLAGTTCENQNEHQHWSGAWFDPERSGEGFIVEVIEDGRGVVYWFTYPDQALDPDPPLPSNAERQAWMTGDGVFDGKTLTIDPLFQPRDTGFLMPSSTEAIENIPVGSLEIRFEDDLNGTIAFISSVPDFPSITYPIERLARPMLANCD